MYILLEYIPKRWPKVRALAEALLPTAWRFAVKYKPHSMLHWAALHRLYRCAASLRPREVILEIGAYTGAATVLMARAHKGQTGKEGSIAIECGGCHAHAQLPSSDILRDLRDFLAKQNVSQRVCLIEGKSGDEAVRLRVANTLAGRKVGLLLIDADGHADRDFALYREFLADGAIVVLDDYETDGTALEKEVLIRPWIETMVNAGTLTEIAIEPWGTWFGRYNEGGH